jgi:hypothetical protein
MLMRSLSGKAPSVELIALDRGPGMADVTRSLADGYSTAGSPGTGLGAIRRLADDFDIYSQPQRGTVLLARLRRKREPLVSRCAFQACGVSVAKRGEAVCGDAWQVQHRPEAALVAIADGLGHGAGAADAATTALGAITVRTYPGSIEALEAMHAALRSTRGAAAALAEIDATSCTVKFTGVGNIAARIWRDGAVRHVVSHNGTLGHQARYFREYSYPWDSRGMLVMHSDGLISHWSFDAYPGLRARDCSTVAAVLYRDYSRDRDDVTVVAVKERA